MLQVTEPTYQMHSILASLEQALLADHVFTPYLKGSTLDKVDVPFMVEPHEHSIE